MVEEDGLNILMNWKHKWWDCKKVNVLKKLGLEKVLK